SVMLIGHNPAIHELAIGLLSSGALRGASGAGSLKQLKVKFPTGAMATLAVPGSWKDLGDKPADLLEFALPRELSPSDGGRARRRPRRRPARPRGAGGPGRCPAPPRGHAPARGTPP